MWPSLSTRTSTNMLLNFAPFLSVKLQGFKESEMLFFSPTTLPEIITLLCSLLILPATFTYYLIIN